MRGLDDTTTGMIIRNEMTGTDLLEDCEDGHSRERSFGRPRSPHATGPAPPSECGRRNSTFPGLMSRCTTPL